MKKLLCLLLAMGLVLGFAACKKQDSAAPAPSSEPSYTVTVEQPLTSVYDDKEEFDFEQNTTENRELTAKGCPPLAENLQKQFAGAKEMVDAFRSCQFSGIDYQVSRQIGNNYYWVIADPRFPTYAELTAYLKTLFTGRFVYENLLTAESCVQPSSEGLACVLQGGKGVDPRYAGYVMRVDSQTPTDIQMTATVYYAPDAYEGEIFYATPANPDFYTTKELKIAMTKTDDGWRFTKFPFIG